VTMLIIAIIFAAFIAGVICGGWWTLTYLQKIDEDV